MPPGSTLGPCRRRSPSGRRAVASQVDGATRLRIAAAPGADDLALWYIPFLAATLLALLAVDALCIWALIR